MNYSERRSKSLGLFVTLHGTSSEIFVYGPVVVKNPGTRRTEKSHVLELEKVGRYEISTESSIQERFTSIFFKPFRFPFFSFFSKACRACVNVAPMNFRILILKPVDNRVFLLSTAE